MPNYSFTKSLRLLDANAYKTVFDDAKLKVSTQHSLFLARQNGLNHPRLGLVIAKKNIRLAKNRNRIKRIIRESFRLQQHQLGAVDTVVLARRGLDQLDNAQLHAVFNRLWSQLEQKSNQQPKVKQSKTDS